MALVLDTEVSGEGANSYCDLTFADEYFENHYSATKVAQWAALSDEAKTTLLIQACRIIESARFTINYNVLDYDPHMRWNRESGQVVNIYLSRRPMKYSNLQKLQFPRNLDYLSDGTVYIPEEIKMAQCEQALSLANVDETTVTNQMQGIVSDYISLGKGDIEIAQKFSGSSGSGSSQGAATLWSPLALEMVKPYLIKGTSVKRG
jgi:hypothetical protein